MKNLSVPESKVKSKPVEVVEEVVVIDPKEIEEIINDYNSLVSKCQKIYNLKADKHMGDLYISLDTLKTIVNKLK